MRNTHQIASELSEVHEQLTTIAEQATEEKRNLSECEEFKSAKSKYDALKTEHENAETLENELRSMPKTGNPKRVDKGGEVKALGAFVKSGEVRYLGAGDTNGNAELARGTRYSNQILESIADNSVMRGKANVVTTSGKSYTDTIGDGDVSSEWNEEGNAYDDASNLSVYQRERKLHKITSYPKATEETIDQSDIVNLEQWLLTKVSRSQGQKEEQAFWFGEGDTANQPKGLLHTTNLSVDFVNPDPINKISVLATGQQNDQEFARAFADAVAHLKSEYAGNAEWYMSRSQYATLLKITDANDRPLIGDLSSSPIGQIFGYPINITDSLENTVKLGNEDVNMIVFGSMTDAYQIVDSTSPVKITRDEVTETGYVKFPTRRYVGGGLRIAEAIKCISINQQPIYSHEPAQASAAKK